MKEKGTKDTLVFSSNKKYIYLDRPKCFQLFSDSAVDKPKGIQSHVFTLAVAIQNVDPLKWIRLTLRCLRSWKFCSCYSKGNLKVILLLHIFYAFLWLHCKVSSGWFEVVMVIMERSTFNQQLSSLKQRCSLHWSQYLMNSHRGPILKVHWEC